MLDKNHPFENIRYMSTVTDQNGYQNIKVKNFHEELSEKYASEPEEFQFIKQYLSIESAELFFADKALKASIHISLKTITIGTKSAIKP